ncbi:MAG: hypothetical protein AAAC48_11610 [Phyllobacterium sp.]|uniref:hypothetical protein n=1 Tax=Phyllobacterium sp. TaxID=1871046 RepID=UPI0030F0CED7
MRSLIFDLSVTPLTWTVGQFQLAWEIDVAHDAGLPSVRDAHALTVIGRTNSVVALARWRPQGKLRRAPIRMSFIYRMRAPASASLRAWCEVPGL